MMRLLRKQHRRSVGLFAFADRKTELVALIIASDNKIVLRYYKFRRARFGLICGEFCIFDALVPRIIVMKQVDKISF